LWDQSWPAVQWGVGIGVSLAGAAFDVRRQRVPNLLVGCAFVSGLAWAATVGGAGGLADAAGGCLIMAAPFVLLFVFVGGGAGDAKLMGALGVWLGVVNGLVALGGVAVSGVVLGVLAAARKKRLREAARDVYASLLLLMFRLLGRGGIAGALSHTPSSQKMPYAVAVFAGVCIAAAGVLLWRAW
jgi:prepilin peptidase CpaA